MMLHLRPWHPADAPALVDAVRSSRDLVQQFGTGIEDEEHARQVITSRMLFTERTRNWAITSDGIPVGNVGLSAIERRNDTAWCHYWLALSARGHGSASRALASVADWAFRGDLFRLELGHRVNNPSSCAVARRAGFIAEGIERKKLKYGTERFDVELHSRLRTDPAPRLDLLSFSQASR